MLTCTLLFFNAFSFRMIFDILPLCVLIYYYINNLFRCCANLYRFYTMGKGVYFTEVQKLFKANKRESAVDIVVNNIKHLLMERKLKPGDRLPSESEISEGMGVSRGSVREAMKILSAFGLVDVKVGNGTYVCEKPGSTLMDSLLLSFFVTNPDPEKLYELRQVIEIDVLEMILRHYDENTAERKALRENLNLLGKLIDKNLSLEQLKTIDLEFHHLMGSCTKNVLMELNKFV
jgi:GntR family transcriptional regulator, transcriptional repressor for pyruvate dehydrogenase complex